MFHCKIKETHVEHSIVQKASDCTFTPNFLIIQKLMLRDCKKVGGKFLKAYPCTKTAPTYEHMSILKRFSYSYRHISCNDCYMW